MPQRELSQEDLIAAIRAISAVTGCREVIVGGRGALVVTAASPQLLVTQDFDVGISVEGDLRGVQTFDDELGRASVFAELHGFYVEHAGAELLTYALPAGWENRAMRFEVDAVVALCLAPVDVVINKLQANRPKDTDHIAAILKEGIVGLEEVQTAIAAVPYAFMIDGMLKSLANALAAAAKS